MLGHLVFLKTGAHQTVYCAITVVSTLRQQIVSVVYAYVSIGDR
jgi:hypothetical protein